MTVKLPPSERDFEIYEFPNSLYEKALKPPFAMPLTTKHTTFTKDIQTLLSL